MKSIIAYFFLLHFFVTNCYSQHFYNIPKQNFKPYEVLGYKNNISINNTDFRMEIDSLNISYQISFGEYKAYLNRIKKDSTTLFYLSQLPDTNITNQKNYTAYILNSKYNEFPVVGISWEAAMNFCKWKTLSEKKGEKMEFIYRLPKLSEWLAAYNFLENNNIKNDFSKNYSDWTISLYFEGAYGLKNDSSFILDMFSFPNSKSQQREKRFRVIGNSYFYQYKNLYNHFKTFYSFKGYRQVAFRVVKENYSTQQNSTSCSEKVVDFWGIQQ